MHYTYMNECDCVPINLTCKSRQEAGLGPPACSLLIPGLTWGLAHSRYSKSLKFIVSKNEERADMIPSVELSEKFVFFQDTE